MKASIVTSCLLLAGTIAQTKAEALALTNGKDYLKEIASIAAMEDGVARLAAYDEYARAIGAVATKATVAPRPGKWQVTTSVSPIDDSKTVIAALTVEKPVSGRFGPVEPMLVLRFMEGRLDAYIDFKTFLGSESIGATLRFGKEAAEDFYLNISTDHEAAFIRKTERFMSDLARTDSLLIRITPYGESPVIASFDTSGAAAVVAALEAASGVKIVRDYQSEEAASWEALAASHADGLGETGVKMLILKTRLRMAESYLESAPPGANTLALAAAIASAKQRLR